VGVGGVGLCVGVVAGVETVGIGPGVGPDPHAVPTEFQLLGGFPSGCCCPPELSTMSSSTARPASASLMRALAAWREGGSGWCVLRVG
jgi:type IV secretory pathway TrbL component